MAASGAALAAATDKALTDPEVKNLIYGEVVHADNSFYRQFVSVENMDALKKNGVTEIAIELPSNLQVSVDWLRSGKRTPEQFKQNMKNMLEFFDMDEATAAERRDLIVDMIRRAEERGIKIKFVDPMNGTNEMAELRKPDNIDKITKCIEGKVGVLTEAELDKIAANMALHVNQMVGECINGDPELRKTGEKFLKERFESDKKLGAEAAARNADGRTVFFYGNAHGATIAEGHPGKSAGIAGIVNPNNSDQIRKMTPFFFYHFNVQSGETSGPSIWQRLFGATTGLAPIPAPA